MLKKHRLMIGATVLAVAVATLTFESIHAAPVSPFTALTIDGAGNDPVLAEGHNVSFAGASVSLSNHDGGATVSSGAYSVEVLPRTGGALAQGTAAVATKTTADATDIGLVVTANGVACTTGAGSITIEQLVTSSAKVTALAASFTTTCGSSTAVIGGEIRFNSTTGFIDATQDKANLNIGTADSGYQSAAQVVTFTSVGSQPIHFGAATVSGSNFKVVTSTCNNATVTTTCTVTVAVNTTTTGPIAGTLTLPDNTTVGSHTVALSADVILGNLGTYHSLEPYRLLDTRSNSGANGPIHAGGVIHFQVSGRGGVPASGVMAVVLNVAETGSTANSFLTVYPTGTSRPTASNLNFTARTTIANSVTVKLGTNGQVDIYNSAGNVQLIADLSGYFVGSDALAAGGQYHPIKPLRLLDTRWKGYGPLGLADYAFAGLTLGSEDLDSHITALAVNITAVDPAATGWFTAWDGKNGIPSASTLDFAKGKDAANMAIVQNTHCLNVFDRTTCGTTGGNSAIIVIRNFAKGNVNVVVDIMGYFDDGSIDPSIYGARFHAGTPTRMVDTRSHLDEPGALAAGQTDIVKVPAALADFDTWALAANVTAVSPTASTFLTFWPQGTRPSLSTLNPAAHQTIANAAIITLNDTINQFEAYNYHGTTGLVIDIMGYYQYDPNTNGPAVVKPEGAAPPSPLSTTHTAKALAFPIRQGH